jgi:hypothetical protein
LNWLHHSLAFRSLARLLALGMIPPNMLEGPASAANPKLA